MSDKVITKMNKYMCVLGLSWETILCTFLTTGPWNWKDSGGWCTITSYCVCWKRNAVLCLQFSACPEKLSTSKKFLLYWLCQSLWLCRSQQTVENSSKEEATVRTRHGTTDWFQIGKGVCRGCILSPCLFNLYAEYIMQKMLGWKKHKLE